MSQRMKRIMAAALAGTVALSAGACKTAEPEQEEASQKVTEADLKTAAEDGDAKEVTIKIAWWGGQTRHEQTQQVLDLYSELHPNVKFVASPSGWDGYFEKLSTQTASGAMPDIVQMDYLYLTTYAKNNSVADLQEFIDNGTIDVSGIDEKLLNTGQIDDKMTGLVLSTSMLSFGYNPDVLAEAGVEEPTADWTWSDFIEMSKKVHEATGKYGPAMDTALDTNGFNYWVRQHGQSLFSEDNKSLGYTDDKICEDYFTMWNSLMEEGVLPNPDEYAQIATLGQEAGPVVTGDAAMIMEWNNYASKLSSVNDKIKMVTPPMSDDSDAKGLWMKPGMFFSVAETSQVKQEAAEFINWFINSKEANDIMMAERGTPVSSEIRDYMISSGKLGEQQKAMFEGVDEAAAICGDTPAPDPVGMSEINEAFKNAANSVYYGQATAEDAAAAFREEANSILERNNK
ncbi:ABC transporter substrate-binding protein [Murimonas intestini]|uniref:Carbohydrate ABC transporter substrate-binding protein (CUT1 family) n=1 Tax=Murimonas intestini TaxID=1337051 RepID=A0AB73T3J9_9FIRM|nr:extracellular solute-binding protein [Murimonas intestini]MCR1841023.1 extracellular solute-binding protein [Murimonas intestini]MCR1865859.1 extracellular solute-binding protein [Murimonas intestini]MCR1883279.1 extracellular solute-binding protein [Murimonas intestini]